MTEMGIDYILTRIDNLLIEPPPMTEQELKAWQAGMSYMKNEVKTILESMKDSAR